MRNINYEYLLLHKTSKGKKNLKRERLNGFLGMISENSKLCKTSAIGKH